MKRRRALLFASALALSLLGWEACAVDCFELFRRVVGTGARFDEVLLQLEKAGFRQTARELRHRYGERTLEQSMLPYLYRSQSGEIPLDALAMFMRHGAVEGHPPPLLKNPGDYSLLVRAVNGEDSAETRTFAHFNHELVGAQNRELGDFLKTLSESMSENARFTRDSEGRVSLLFYPRYPEGSPSNTHTKILVDGEVWSTIGFYEDTDKGGYIRGYVKHRSIDVHARKARMNVKDSFFQYDIHTSQEEIARAKYLLTSNDRRGTGRGESCIGTTCALLRESGVIDIPPPFSVVPSLAPLYLEAVRRFPKGKKIELQFQGANALHSLMSVDILVDGAMVGGVTLFAASNAYMIYEKAKQTLEGAPGK